MPENMREPNLKTLNRLCLLLEEFGVYVIIRFYIQLGLLDILIDCRRSDGLICRCFV